MENRRAAFQFFAAENKRSLTILGFNVSPRPGPTGVCVCVKTVMQKIKITAHDHDLFSDLDQNW